MHFHLCVGVPSAWAPHLFLLWCQILTSEGDDWLNVVYWFINTVEVLGLSSLCWNCIGGTGMVRYAATSSWAMLGAVYNLRIETVEGIGKNKRWVQFSKCFWVFVFLIIKFTQCMLIWSFATLYISPKSQGCDMSHFR